MGNLHRLGLFTTRVMKRFFPIFICLVLAGCATKLEPLSANYQLGVESESVVIGRYEDVFHEGEKPSRYDKGLFGAYRNSRLSLENKDTGADYTIELPEPRSDFYVALPPGEYEIKKWEGGKYKLEIFAGFEVPQGGQLVYVGTLKFVRDRGAKGFFSRMVLEQIPGKMSVSDDYDAIVGRFREKYPQLDQDIVRSPIELQKRKLRLFDF